MGTSVRFAGSTLNDWSRVSLKSAEPQSPKSSGMS